MRRVKKTTKSTIKRMKLALGEHIRVVPLHHPEPPISIAELGRVRREPEAETVDFFDCAAHPAPTSVRLTYRNGVLIANVEVFTIFWGKLWGSTPSSTDLMGKLNTFFTDILVSPAIDPLAEYSVPGQAIGRGSFIGTKVISANAPAGNDSDSSIRAQIKQGIAGTTVPKNTKNTLYFTFLGPALGRAHGFTPVPTKARI